MTMRRMLDQERTLVLVVVGVVAAVSCFVLWGPNPNRSSRKKGNVIGLVNFGNTCFLNTLLQALASCPMFLEWLLDRDDPCTMAVTLRKVLQILNGISKEPIIDPYAPTEVITALRLQGWQISPGEQDAHELLLILLDVLEEEFMRSSPQSGCFSQAVIEMQGRYFPDVLSSLSNLSGDSRSGDGRSVNGKEENEMIVRKCTIMQLPTPLPLRGMISSQLKCTLCGHKTALRFDKVDTLSLALPSVSRGRLTLRHLLEAFVKTEIIPNVVCEHCSSLKAGQVRATAYKTLTFGKLPKVLCMHIVRTTLNSVGQPCKREDYVDFEEYIAMDDFVHSHRSRMKKVMEKIGNVKTIPSHGEGEMKTLPPVLNRRKTSLENAKHLYRLKAVIEHVGDVHSGHFVTYRKGLLHTSTRHRTNSVEVRENENASHPNRREQAREVETRFWKRFTRLYVLCMRRWYYTSDTLVKPSTLCEALQATAYMLFYEKCQSNLVS